MLQRFFLRLAICCNLVLIDWCLYKPAGPFHSKWSRLMYFLAVALASEKDIKHKRGP